ncbi:FAD binding domain-containing protein [Paenibacillus sp. sgz500958]|uniref:FAD binding domain-containing protein n=1 Tax=Paenibacillus sp. sgz500958 TaxID=3242475 RepID=UPI0036D3A1AB
MGALEDEVLRSPRLHQPHSLQEAWELKSSLGADALYVSGGTLLRTQWEAGTVPMPGHLIDLRRITELASISSTEMHLTLGALVTLSDCRRNEEVYQVAPAVQEAARCIAAPSVRNLGTLGGNISSGYGDILPALLIYDAELVTYNGNFLKITSVREWLDERWNGRVPAANLVAGIRIAPPVQEMEGEKRLEVFRKVGRREAFTASLVTVALAATLSAERRMTNVRIAAGGGSGRPQRLQSAEAVLEGAVYEEQMLPAIFEAVAGSFETYTDPFATEAYKKKTAGNIVVSELWKAMN